MADGGVAGVVESSAASETTGKRNKRWLPLESNPEVCNHQKLYPTIFPIPLQTKYIDQVLNKYCEKLGFPTALYQWTDVLSVDDWAQEMVPKPVKAVVLLFPVKEASELHRKEEAETIAKEGQKLPETYFYTKQTVGNACGTVAVFHAVGNLSETFGGDIAPVPDSYFARFFERVKGKTPDEIADVMEEDDELEVSHSETATAEGNATEASEDVDTHFICFVEKSGHLLELDGRKDTPINHGPTTPESFLADACKVAQGFMDRDPGEMRFNLMALAANNE